MIGDVFYFSELVRKSTRFLNHRLSAAIQQRPQEFLKKPAVQSQRYCAPLSLFFQ